MNQAKLRALQLRVLVPVVVDVPGLVGDNQVVVALLNRVLEQHEIGGQHLVHAADRLEGVQLVLTGFELDVAGFACEPRAQGVDALAMRLQQPRDWVLRQPVHLQLRMQPAQLPRDGDVAAPMAEPDRRGDVERPLRWPRPRRAPSRRRDAKPAVHEVDDQRVALRGIAAERVVAAAGDGDELRPRRRRHRLRVEKPAKDETLIDHNDCPGDWITPSRSWAISGVASPAYGWQDMCLRFGGRR